MKTFLKAFCVVFSLMFANTAVQAVPSLGIGTGTYNCTGATEYYECFSGNSATGEGEGFSLENGGGTIFPWTNITDGSNIWLLAEESIGSFTFNGASSTSSLNIISDFSSYNSPYQGINLGPVDATWTEITSAVFNPDTFYMLPGTVTFDATAEAAGDWFFLVADNDGTLSKNDNGGCGPDDFSMKTTAAVVAEVPEPGTLLLLGAGLLGLPLFRPRRN